MTNPGDLQFDRAEPAHSTTAGAAFAAWRGDEPAEGDNRALVEYIALTVTLSVLTPIPVRAI